MKKKFIITRSVTTLEGKPHVETISEDELIHCKDCMHFSICDKWANAPLPVLVETGVKMCSEWNKETKENGYCFKAKRRRNN